MRSWFIYFSAYSAGSYKQFEYPYCLIHRRYCEPLPLMGFVFTGLFISTGIWSTRFLHSSRSLSWPRDLLRLAIRNSHIIYIPMIFLLFIITYQCVWQGVMLLHSLIALGNIKTSKMSRDSLKPHYRYCDHCNMIRSLLSR